MKAYRFVHLNVHSHYSIMDGCASIRELVDAAIKDGMTGIAITDNCNKFGIMEFFDYVCRINIERQKKGKKPFKPIIGCELYVAKNGSKDKKDGHKDLKGFHLTVLAKNLTGYKNLIKIVSNSWTDGFYGSPRIDCADLEKYHEGLIVLSGSVGSEVFNKIVNDDIAGLEETVKWYKNTFADDFYIELRRYADLFTNSFSNLYLIDNLSELWLDDDDYLSQDLISIEKEAVEYKKTIIVFVSFNDSCVNASYIKNRLF